MIKITWGHFIKPTHLTDYLHYNAETYPDKAAVIFENQTITWHELWVRVVKASKPIASQLGRDRQDVVLMLMPNSIDFIIAYLSILHSGHMALPLDPAYKKLEIEAMVNQIPSKLMIADAELKKIMPDNHPNIHCLDTLDLLGGTTNDYLRMPSEKQIASLTFTSGTTGKPKTVPNTHANHIWNVRVCSEIWEWSHDDSLLISLPLSHWYGLVMGLAGAIYHANTLYLHKWFDENDTFEALSSGKITLFTHAASAFVKLVGSADKDYDLSGVRICISGGAPLPPAVWNEFKERFGIEIVETYGSSETGRIAGNRLNDRRTGSPGKPLPGVDLKLSDDGEVQIKSLGVFPGYYMNPEATESSMTKDGYWRTGDIAELRDGYVFLKGRTQERIRRYGYTVSPRDVEWALHQHPKIKDAYVMGRQKAGEPNDELFYFLVGSIDDGELHSFCKENLIFAWRPDRIVHLKEIPRTRSGKVSMPSLKKIAEED